MSGIKKIFLIMFLFITAAEAAAEAYKRAGTSGAQFLKLGRSARATGMADAYCAVQGEIDQLWYNPAGVYSPAEYDMSMMLTRHIGEINFFNIAAKKKFNKIGDIGLGFAGMSVGQFRTEYNGNSWEQTQDVVRAGSILFVGNYSRPVVKYITAGMNLKLLNDSMGEGTHDFNFATDIGGLLELEIFDKRLRGGTFAMSFINLGTKTGFGDEKFSIPVSFRSGAAYDWKIAPKHELLTSFEFEKVRDRGLKFNMGWSYKFLQAGFLRLGYRIGDRENGFKFGSGFQYRNARLDYSFDWGELGFDNRVEIGYAFDVNRAKKSYDSIETLYYLGVNAFNNDDFKQSKKYFLLILKISPDHTRTLERMKEISDIEEKQRKLDAFRNAMLEAE